MILSIPEQAVSASIDVPFHDCDPLGVVWHGRYFEYFELARTELMRSISLDVEEIRALGYMMFVVDSHCRWMRPLRYGDKASCRAWFIEPQPHLRIAFDLRTLAGDRCARATMTFAVTFNGKLLTEIPKAFQERLPAYV